MARKIKIGFVLLPFGSCPSVESYSLAAKYLEKKYNIEYTYFIDGDFAKESGLKMYNGVNLVFLKGLDTNIRLFKPLSVLLNVLGLPHFFYPGLKDKLKGYDIIQSSNPENYIFGIQSYFAARKYHSKFILHSSSTKEVYLFRLTRFLITPLLMPIMRNIDMFLFTNPEAKDKYETSGFFGHNPNRAMVVGLALNTDVFRSIKVKKYSIPTIISVGGLYKVKGHQLVIQAFKKLVDRGLKNVRLHVYGRGDYKGKLVKLVHSLKLDDYVEFKGHVSHEELAEAYNKAHLLVVANLKEFTTPIGEAMLCNLPVVAMGCGGIRYAIPDDSYGFVAKRLNLEDLADKMERLIKDDRLREKISRKGRDYTLKTFGYQAVAERSYDAYSKLIT